MIIEGICEYEWLESFRRGYNDEVQETISRAVERYRSYVDFESEEELAVIKVDGFKCLIKCYDFYAPCEFVNKVQPFDIEKGIIYPLQGVKTKIDWVYGYEE